MDMYRGVVTQPHRLDFPQAVSGVLLACFIGVHLLLEGSVIVSPALTDGIARLLEETYIAQAAAPLIVLLIVFHFCIAARKMPFRAGELRTFIAHSKEMRHADTWLWLVQVVTAVIILVLAFSHVYGVMLDLPIASARSAARLHGGWLAFYLVLLPAVILHTGIGVYRLGVKYGLCTRANRARWRKALWLGMGGYLALGLLGLIRVWFLGTGGQL